MSHSAERRGILAGGNFIIDYVKIIDRYPEQDTLASIVRESRANGGGPYNLLKDLAALGAGFPLEAAGRVGDDANGRWVLDDCAAAGIGTAQLRVLPGAPTSYTDAMTVESTGRRTFFHQRGANARLEAGDFELWHWRVLLSGLYDAARYADSFDDGGRTRFSRALEAARAAGLRTCADLVSTEHAWIAVIANLSLPFVDVLVLNEIEVRITGIPLRRRHPAGGGGGAALIEVASR
ncbi:MAG: carbohydrate kinase family protein [Verrucomicrobiales bacterium]